MLIAGIICFTNISCDNNPTKKINQQNLLETEKRLEQESVLPILKFDFDTYDFGEVTDGEIVEVDYIFKNIGKSNLIIFDASASCGCTVPEYPKNVPIPPGGTGELLVSFNSSGNPNMQQKTVTISANTDSGRETVRIMAMVTPDPVRQKARDAQQAARLQQQSNN